MYAVAGHIGGGRVLAVVDHLRLCRLPRWGRPSSDSSSAISGLHHTMAVPAVLCAGIVGLAANHAQRDDADLSTTH
mgnify:CR=1 FL=1